MSMTLGEVFPAELDRVRQVQAEYVKIGPVGAMHVMYIGALVRQAELAWATQDAVDMLRLLERLKAVE